MIVIPFKAGHLHNLEFQNGQAHLSDWVTPAHGYELEKHSSFTGVINGVPIGCAGIIPQWEGRSLVWSFIAEVKPTQFVAIHKAVTGFLDECRTPRIEMTVDCDFTAAHRWAKMLGFTMEAERMRGYSPDGSDCSLYARVL